MKKFYIFFQILAVCIGVCVYMDTTFLVGEIADRFLSQALNGYNILLLTKNQQKRILLSTFERNIKIL